MRKSFPPVHGMAKDAVAFYLHQRRQKVDKPHLHIVAEEQNLSKLKAILSFLNPGYRIAILPPWDCLPYDRVSPHTDVMAARLQALQTLENEGVDFILTTPHGLIQRLPPVEKGATWALKPGDTLNRETFLKQLMDLGYRRQDMVYDVGEFAVRGSLIDLFAPTLPHPIRLDFFDETLESIHPFDPATQRRGESLQICNLAPLGEVRLTPETIRQFREGYRQAFAHRKGVTERPLYEAISNHQPYLGMEHWLPLFYPTLPTLWDLLPPDIQVTLGNGALEGLESFAAQIQEHYQARLELDQIETKAQGAPYDALPTDALYQPLHDVWEHLSARNAALFSPFHGPDQDGGTPPFSQAGWDGVASRQRGQRDLTQSIAKHLAHHEATGKQLLITGHTAGSLQQLAQLLEPEGVSLPAPVTCSEQMDAPLATAILPLHRGFETQTLTVLTEEDVFGKRLREPTTSKGRQKNLFRTKQTFEVGEVVVHRHHGLGQYQGLETLDVGTGPHDYLKLLYSGGDHLFVPVENMDLLSRYGQQTDHLNLDKLGVANWQNRKARVKKRLYAIARHLIQLAAARAVKEGLVFSPTPDFEAFCNRFPFAETPDQMNAIEDVLRDLQAGKPMDRLICGDVGFGKTEVAMRAAHVVASNGSQVAVIVPTTLLARQHTEKFQERFRDTNLRIAQLSRLVPPKEATKIKQELAEGNIDIIIATHGLLADSTRFQNLGLLVVDEEQHFGVKQKEKLKKLCQNVHVLTLTATPIPRTLQLSLTGVRDLSLIATPPTDRFAVRTFILPFDGMVMREAILRERSRGGQIFYVCPRISDLDKVQERLRRFVPEVRLGVAHGQLTPKALEDIMMRFDTHDIDVLVATNIIESGIDIANANTLFVHRSDLFGLAQLYQLRGRVGRGKVRGYAYLTLANQELTSPTALRRLEVLQSLDALGSGFSLASHDMDIRGAGNLVGEEQSGHIREVGVELYQKLLEEAIQEQRSGTTKSLSEDKGPQLTLHVPFRIPESYIPALEIRLELYQRLADLQDEAGIQSFAAELTDRFGPYPKEVDHLLASIHLKRLCMALGIEDLKVTEKKGVFVRFFNNTFANPERLISWIQTRKDMRLNAQQRLIWLRAIAPSTAGLNQVQAFLKQLLRLTQG